jgi:hypothetical protein
VTPVRQIQDIKPVPYLHGKSYPPGTTCRIEVNPTPASRTHTMACAWANKKHQPKSVQRVKYMEVFVADVPLEQLTCDTCKGGR